MSKPLMSAKEARAIAMMYRDKNYGKIIERLILNANLMINNAIRTGKTSIEYEYPYGIDLSKQIKDIEIFITTYFNSHGYVIDNFQYLFSPSRQCIKFTIDW